MYATVLNTTDCYSSLLIYEFSLVLFSERDLNADVFDSLQLLKCNVTLPKNKTTTTTLKGLTAHQIQSSCGLTVYVNASGGNDGGNGSESSPLATLGGGLGLVRRQRSPNATSCIVLRQGVHYLSSTLTLDSEDSGMIWTSAPGDGPVWVSGGVALTGSATQWSPYNVSGSWNIYMTPIPEGLNYDTLSTANLLSPHSRLNNGQYPNYDIETGTGEIQQPWGPGGSVVDWLKPALFPLPNYYYQPINKSNSGMAPYNMYSTGKGGACGHWRGDLDGNGNYYCGTPNATGGGWVMCDKLMSTTGFLGIPVGLIYNQSMLPHFSNWRLPPLADKRNWKLAPTLTAWQGSPGGGGGWFNNRFWMTAHDPSTGFINLSADGVWPAGGWQGGRTWHTVEPMCGTTGPLISGNWHVNGVFEELDAPGEYYADLLTQTLYYFHNASAGTPPPRDLTIISPQLEVFFNLTGTPTAPVADVSFLGIGLRDQRDGFLEDWIVPSGGDWGLRRAGLFHFAGTERVTVSGCTFVRTDGNAVMISGYNRNATVRDSEFSWLGMSAVALQGSTVEEDGTAGLQPFGTVISHNIVKEIGLLEKQSSAVFLSRSALTRVESNLFFNGPRAMINFNDPGGGGHNITSNAIWNTCRETGDHGPMNSWDRQPFSNLVSTGGLYPSFDPAYTATHKNVINAGYGGSQVRLSMFLSSPFSCCIFT